MVHDGGQLDRLLLVDAERFAEDGAQTMDSLQANYYYHREITYLNLEYSINVVRVVLNGRVRFAKLLFLPTSYHCPMSFTTPAITQLTSSPKRGSEAPSAM